MTDIITNPLTGLPVEESEIKSLSELCVEQEELELRIAKGTALLKELGKRLDELSTKLIPDKMDQLGFRTLTLSSGKKIEIKPFYSGKIKDKAAFTWLDEHGHGGIIKTCVKRDFPRNKRDEALEFAQANGLELDESIHHSTLNAFVKEILSDPESGGLPEYLFSVYQGSRTKLS